MITISERLKPFSHRPQMSCLIPTTSYEVEAFPALLRIYDIKKGIRNLIHEKEINVSGPVKNFTLCQDLEKTVVTVFGTHFFYHITPDLTFHFQKKPPLIEKMSTEKLFLGVHKLPDWDNILRRRDFREILPFWFALGGGFKNIAPPKDCKGVFALLAECEQVIFDHRPEKIIPIFEKLFLAGFRNLLVPRLKDDDHQGIISEESEGNPLFLLSYGYQLIRSLFIEKRGERVFILPNCPPELFAGKLINSSILPYGTFSLEWSKKMVRRLVFHSEFSGTLSLVFPSSTKTFRLRRTLKERGERHSCGAPLEISQGVYYLDRFEK